VLLKDDIPFVLGVNLLPGQFDGDFLSKQEQSTANGLAIMPDALGLAVLQCTAFPLRIAFATVIMTFWYLESIRDGFHFCFASLCFAHFSILTDSQVLMPLLDGVFPTDQRDRDLSIFFPAQKNTAGLRAPGRLPAAL
jgi:hypothetical protein